MQYIEQNSNTTQRELAQHASISVGAINFLLKRMVKTGWIKIEKLQPGSVKYFLTPSGLASKVERTYSYIKRTYRELNWLKARIVTITNNLVIFHNLERLYFIGERDEFFEIIHDLIQTKSFSIPCSLEQTMHKLKIKNESLIIVWDYGTEETLTKQGFRCINIMSKIKILE